MNSPKGEKTSYHPGISVGSPPAEPEVMRLSYSVAHTMNTKTPLHAWDKHRLGGNNKGESTKAMDDGKLMEKFVLGADLDQVVIIEADNFTTNKAKEARDLALAGGFQPVTRKKYEEAQAAAKVIVERFKNHGKRAVDLTRVTDMEKGLEVFVQYKVTWKDKNGVECSGVIDRLELDHFAGVATIYDFKTTSDASTKKFTRSVWDNGYHIQKASYEDAVSTIWPKFASRMRYLFLVAELDSPFVVRVLRLGGLMADLGSQAWENAKTRWAECLAKDKWPGYPDEAIEAEKWMYDEAMMGDEEDEDDQRDKDIREKLAAGDGPLLQAMGGLRAE